MILRPVSAGGGSVVGQRVRRALAGVQNQSNQAFTTPEKFTRAVGFEEWVLYNGQMLEAGVGCDYTVSESGGVGSGFDTITFETIAPHSDDNLRIVYFPA
jgi:hypothetical protein